MTGGVGRWVGAGVGALAGLVLLVGTAAGAAVGVVLGGPEPATSAGAGAVDAIPAEYVALYQRAAATCPGLPWTVLAAIGTIESGNGTSNQPGVHSRANSAGAEGPMQFEPATFAEFAEPVPPGGADPANPYDPTDSVYAGARLLCANGARDGADLPGAVFAYNHARWYVVEVLTLAGQYQLSEETDNSLRPASDGLP